MTRHRPIPQPGTVGSVGGQLIDLTTPESQSDQLSCFYPGNKRFDFNQSAVEIEVDGGKLKNADFSKALAAVVFMATTRG